MALKIVVTAVAAIVGFKGAENKLVDPLQLVQNNDGKMMFIPVIYAKEGQDIVINPSAVIYTADPVQSMIDAYDASQKHLSAARAGIVLVGKKDEKLLKFTRN